MFRSGETLGLFTGNKGGHSEHFLKFSALYYFFPFQNLKFLAYKAYTIEGVVIQLTVWLNFSHSPLLF